MEDFYVYSAAESALVNQKCADSAAENSVKSASTDEVLMNSLCIDYMMKHMERDQLADVRKFAKTYLIYELERKLPQPCLNLRMSKLKDHIVP